jgi:hypothetical protein
MNPKKMTLRVNYGLEEIINKTKIPQLREEARNIISEKIGNAKNQRITYLKEYFTNPQIKHLKKEYRKEVYNVLHKELNYSKFNSRVMSKPSPLLADNKWIKGFAVLPFSLIVGRVSEYWIDTYSLVTGINKQELVSTMFSQGYLTDHFGTAQNAVPGIIKTLSDYNKTGDWSMNTWLWLGIGYGIFRTAFNYAQHKGFKVDGQYRVNYSQFTTLSSATVYILSELHGALNKKVTSIQSPRKF